MRSRTEALCRPLSAEDHVIQTMRDVSPAKWHLAHTTWFFETLVLRPYLDGYREFDPAYRYLFNSYYNSLGPQFDRQCRGVLSRPTVAETLDYRRYVDRHVATLLEQPDHPSAAGIVDLLTLGLNHEQQHQELILTDIKHVFACNPLRPVYREGADSSDAPAPPMRWHEVAGGRFEIGHGGPAFAYDNESPRHGVLLNDFALASRLVTNGEYLEFIEDGGYATARWWLSDAWATVASEQWQAPLYWERRDDRWMQMTLAGMRPVDPAEPLCHVSFFEADAYARWRGARLPTEAEWEVVAAPLSVEGNFAETGRLHPARAEDGGGAPAQMFGDAWEWTASPYVPYPGYRPPAGPLGEYNAKFMCNQMVLRGGSCVTPRTHIRATYRNFFPPDARWQFTGFRLARDPSR